MYFLTHPYSTIVAMNDPQNDIGVPSAAAADDSPKFGRLLLVLVFAVLLVVAITFGSEALFS
jgi:hypothetical protein